MKVAFLFSVRVNDLVVNGLGSHDAKGFAMRESEINFARIFTLTLGPYSIPNLFLRSRRGEDARPRSTRETPPPAIGANLIIRIS